MILLVYVFTGNELIFFLVESKVRTWMPACHLLSDRCVFLLLDGAVNPSPPSPPVFMLS